MITKKNIKIKNFYILINLIFWLVFTNGCYAEQFLPKHKAIPGGIAIIPLELNSTEAPIVYLYGKPVLVTKYNTNTPTDPDKPLSWIAVVGIPITTKPGIHKISVHAEPTSNNRFKINFEKSFLISNYNYRSEHLKIDHRLVVPYTQTDLDRSKKETEAIKAAYRHQSQQIPNLKLQRPTIGRVSSAFGIKRILNGKSKGYHSGLDLAAPIGTAVYAPSSGQVILTGNFFFTGNTIFIDHGHGLITSYFHLNSVKVEKGENVDTNTLIGTVGATGRVTGPHLHWSVSLNDARINPELFLK